jgi:putative DNA primase/helicase
VVAGALEWQRRGLDPPAVIREQTERYRASEDNVAAFLADDCTIMPGLKIQAGVLYAAARKWAERNGARVPSARDFAAEIAGRGFEKRRGAKGEFYYGISLQAEELEDRFRD